MLLVRESSSRANTKVGNRLSLNVNLQAAPRRQARQLPSGVFRSQRSTVTTRIEREAAERPAAMHYVTVVEYAVGAPTVTAPVRQNPQCEITQSRKPLRALYAMLF